MYGEIREYLIFDRDARPIFGQYRSLAAATAVVVDCIDVTGENGRIYKPLFPVTIEALDSSDICTKILTMVWE